MYSTCIFCNSSLGANEAIEHFPVGRRLAFDSAKGRLWVVCKKCERWNLSPLETRWEAIEEAERAYRGTKLRVSTDNVGLARLAEGTELVRIGAPLRPEFAAWRYGDQFGKRQRRFIARSVAGFGAMGATPYIIGGERIVQVLSLGPVLSTTILMAGIMPIIAVATSGNLWRQHQTPLVTVHDNNSNPLPISKVNAMAASISPAGHAFDWQLKLPHMNMRPTGRIAHALGIRQINSGSEMAVLRHDAARNALATILPHTNQSGGGKRAVKAALDVLSDAPGVQYLLHLAATSEPHRELMSLRGEMSKRGEILLGLLPSSLRSRWRCRCMKTTSAARWKANCTNWNAGGAMPTP